LFEGKTADDVLVSIIKVLGAPSQHEVKAMNPKYPYKGKLRPQTLKRSSLFHSKCPDTAIDLMFRMIAYDPGKRITAIEALAHPFF